MSYILDALKKSEQERNTRRGLVFGDAGERPVRSPRPAVLWLLAAAALVAAGALVVSVWPPHAQRAAQIPASVGADAPLAPLTPPAAEPHSAVRTATRDLAEHLRAPPAAPREPPPRAVTTGPRPAASPVASAAVPADVPFLRSLPEDFRRSLPELTVNIHVYTPEASQRILYINNRQYHAGEAIQEGLVVEEIVPDGAVLRYRGQRFKLPRPS